MRILVMMMPVLRLIIEMDQLESFLKGLTNDKSVEGIDRQIQEKCNTVVNGLVASQFFCI